ncbi:glycosyltransferase family 9 protein [uncultured Planktosalinus sp.]|uniref:glycosyltransferase family 9 protein n=1 Tax=uncultured Planktosalinus sp. TaxID=1810935 RepID=UPI0030DC9B87
MSIKKLNPIKNSILKFFTDFFQNTKTPKGLSLQSDQPLTILITRPNHRLGNQLLFTPLIRELELRFPNATIDIVVNGNLSFILFSEFDSIRTIYNLPKKPFNNILKYIKKATQMMSKKYDLAIAGEEGSNSSKIFVKLSRSRNKIYDSGECIENKPTHISKKPIYSFLKYIDPAIDLKDYTYPQLSIKLTEDEIKQGNTILNGLFNNQKETICIYTFATGRKCHSKEWWSGVYDAMKKEFTNYNILEMLPIENVSQIDFDSVHFYSKDLREIAAVIENCSLFFGADSGMMHLSAATNTPTIGLFNVTKPKIYAPYGNKNLFIDTNTTQVDEIINQIKAVTV